jgi:metal-responsive CopG/Arc/MetJ family transcriptional regulator
MQTIQVVLDEDLLRATDRLAKESSVNRSALIRTALKEYLKKEYYRELERRDRKGFERLPDNGELTAWEGVASWPEK